MDELITHVSEKTYAYGAIRAENQNLLVTISELKARMKNGENGKSVNTKFDKTHGSQSFLCVTPLNKNAFQKQTVVLKTKENHVESKPVTSQTSHTKQTGTHQNTNVISPGMYRVVTQQESQTNKSKNVLSSTGMNATSSVKRPKSRDSHVKTSVLDVSKNEAKKEAVYVRQNKQTDNTFANVVSNKDNVIDVAAANASKAKTLLCVSCMKSVLIPTRFSEKVTQSKNLDTTSVASKSKINKASASKARDKVVQIVLWVVDSGCSKHMTGDRALLRNFVEKFIGTVRFGNVNFASITGYGDYIHGNITICHVYYVEGDDLLTGRRDSLYIPSPFQTCAAYSPIMSNVSKATLTNSCYGIDILILAPKNDLSKLALVDGLPKFKYEKGSLFVLLMKRGKSRSFLIHRNVSPIN
ncbi:hypothetical protein Tco_1505504 [Tanacetum coccineum]